MSFENGNSFKPVNEAFKESILCVFLTMGSWYIGV